MLRKMFLSLALLLVAYTQRPAPAAIGQYYYGYCYWDCSPCWSGNHGSDCPFHTQCTQIPLC